MERPHLVLFLAIAAVSTATEVIYRFKPWQVFALNHLAVDKYTGKVYIGAVNRIFQLTPDLELLAEEQTGPEVDSVDDYLIDYWISMPVQKKLMDNYNKALVIDYTKMRLISCGSLFQGSCTVRNLQDISNGTKVVKEPVVNTEPNASTVAFIAPGPRNPVMYVGVSFTPRWAGMPAVTSRSLDEDKMFTLANTAVTTGTRMYINSFFRQRYVINYVHGFASEGFSYFLTTQMESVSSSRYTSKLVRICHDDDHYYSYTEIRIKCAAEDGVDYNLVQAAYVGKVGSDLASYFGITTEDDVLFAVFSKNEASENAPSNMSALCVYPLKAVRRKFMVNIRNCFAGKGNTGLDFIVPSRPCIRTTLLSIREDFCGVDESTPLGGVIPIISVPVLSYNNTRLTAVASTSTGDFTIVFLGTASGHLKTILLDSFASGKEYGDLEVEEGSSINPDMHFDPQHRHVYVMTRKTVSKVKIHECDIHKTCEECIGTKEPFCGWCPLEYKCSLRSNCQDADKDPLYWINNKNDRCTTVTSVTLNQIEVTKPRTVQLVIHNLLNYTDHLSCAFAITDKVFITNASRTGDAINCNTPGTDDLPSISSGEHHLDAKLSIRTTSEPDFVATNITFYDCNTYYSCSQCVASAFSCDWCLDGNRCTHDTENCLNDVVITGINRIGSSQRSGPKYCPAIHGSTIDNFTEILVASGDKTEICLSVHVLDSFILQTRLFCQFNVKDKIETIGAHHRNKSICCDEIEFHTSDAATTMVTLAMIWGGSRPLDNPENVHIVIYSCRDMADDCGTCLSLAEKYGCSWCQNSDSCEMNERCLEGVWMSRNETCSNTK